MALDMAGATIGAQAISSGMGIFGALVNNKLAAEREATARKENFEYNERAAEAADARTRALYNDLQSPAALLSQYREAGLSPSLMFAGGGGQGAQPSSGAQGSGAAGISPTTYGIPTPDMAQTVLALAQARKANAEAATEEGTNERGKAEIANIIEKTNNITLKNAYQEYANALSEIDLTVQASTFEKQIENFYKESEYLVHKVRSAAVKADIDEKSENDILQGIKAQVMNTTAEAILKQSETQLNAAKVNLTTKQIEDILSQIHTREGTLQLGQEKLQKQVEQWAIENGYTERGQNIEIGKAIANFITEKRKAGAQLLDAIIPL